MKKLLLPALTALTAAMLFTGCSWSVGGGHTSQVAQPTVGQQLMDLQKAKDSGAINDSEYRLEKDKILQGH
jgi:hypothetical protein